MAQVATVAVGVAAMPVLVPVEVSKAPSPEADMLGSYEVLDLTDRGLFSAVRFSRHAERDARRVPTMHRGWGQLRGESFPCGDDI
jgi:hypothetical protein